VPEGETRNGLGGATGGAHDGGGTIWNEVEREETETRVEEWNEKQLVRGGLKEETPASSITSLTRSQKLELQRPGHTVTTQIPVPQT
jgi:hypothetical protein